MAATASGNVNGSNSIKITIVGDPDVGKSCFLLRHATNTYPVEGTYTSFADTYRVDSNYAGAPYTQVWWDTRGHDEFRKVRPPIYVGSDLIVVCYACDSPSSFDNVLSKWVPEVQHHWKKALIVLICTKIDQRQNQAKVDELKEQLGRGCVGTDEGVALAQQVNAVTFLETSAKDNIGFAGYGSELSDAIVTAAIDARRARQRKPARCAIL